jgi:Ca2+-binding EF-hand superfamily protein
MAADPGNSLFLSAGEFQLVMQKCGNYVGDHVFKELCTELDPKETGRIPYQAFLDTLYITKMYLNEMTLYGILKEADVEKRGGVSIKQMKDILKTHPEFELPDEALGTTFKIMLGADID